MDSVYPGLSDLEEVDDFLAEGHLIEFDPFPEFIAASGEVNFEYPDRVEYPDVSMSNLEVSASTAGNTADYNATTASSPLTLLGLPYDVRRQIYALFLGPATEVAIHSFTKPPKLDKAMTSPTPLFLVSSKVYREAAAVFYGTTIFHLQHHYGICYMTGHMGLDNCRKIRHFTTFMDLVWNIPLTIRTVFPQLETLSVLPQSKWFQGPWFDHLHKRHGGYYQAAIEEAVNTSQAKAVAGLRELMDMSRHYWVNVSLPFWNNADMTRRPVAIDLAMRYPRWTVTVM